MKSNNELLEASKLHFKAKCARAEANLKNYLNNPAAIGEHPDLVEEVIKLVQQIAEAKEALEYIGQYEVLNENQN